MKYGIGWHSSDETACHVAFTDAEGEVDEIFDVTLHSLDDDNDAARKESLAALELLVARANGTLDAIARIQVMTEEAEARIPQGSEYEAMEEHGYIEALNDVTNMLHLLALGQTPAQGSEKSDG